MPTKEQAHSTDKATARRRPVQPAVQEFDGLAQQMHPATIVQRARLAPRSMAPNDVQQLQRTIGNQAVGQLLAGTNQRQPIQTEENTTGLPDKLKAGIENLSGMSMDDVKVYYDFPKLVQLQALAYTQGTDIHVGPGAGKKALQFKQISSVTAKNWLSDTREPSNTMGPKEEEASDSVILHNSVINPPFRKPVIQRIIDNYQPGKLRANSKAIKGLNDRQKEQIQVLHDDAQNTYTIDQARQKVGAPPLSSSSSNSRRLAPPLPFRYAASGEPTMSTVSSGPSGLVQYPQNRSGGYWGAAEEQQISVVSGSTYTDLPTSNRRAVTQSAVMDQVSPNAAAAALRLPCPNRRAWEWLHLVAFSIRETHIPSLSAQSMQLIQRTDQPQQIRENLVLGTAAANTAMLSYETAIKNIMKNNPSWTLALYVAAQKENYAVYNKSRQQVMIPLCKRIDYHFYFTTGDGKVIPPVILAFDTLDHHKPPLSEYWEVATALTNHIANALNVTNPLMGIDTSRMHAL